MILSHHKIYQDDIILFMTGTDCVILQVNVSRYLALNKRRIKITYPKQKQLVP